MLRATVAALAVGTAAAANLRWNGTPLDFENCDLWDVCPGAADATIGTVTIGAPAVDTFVTLSQGASLSVGRRIDLSGDVRIQLGNGGAGRTTLQLDGFASGDDATFSPGTATNPAENAVASGFNWNCNRNWLTTNGEISARAPCENDIATISTADGFARMINTYSIPSAASRIIVQSAGNTERAQACDPNEPNEITFNAPVTIAVNRCASNFKFPGTTAASFSQCPDPVCAGTTIVTDQNGNEVQVVTSGPDAGTAFIRNGDTVQPTQMDSTEAADGTTTYSLPGTNISADSTGNVFPPAASSGSDDSSSSGTIIIIIVVIALILIIGIIVVVVVVVKKQGSGSSGTRDGGIVSFENPMYDDLENTQKGAEQQGTYDEPELASSGYMDVPAGSGNDDGATGFGTGYMDVAPGGGSGYMDVAPGADDDDDDGDI